MTADILEERKKSIISSDFCCQGDGSGISCEKESVSGAVSQRACVYCGARVVLNPITDAFHIIHVYHQRLIFLFRILAKT